MKIPSLSLMFRQAKETFLRFPFVIIIAAAGAYSMIRITGFSYDYPEALQHIWINIAMTCLLGIPLFLSFGLFSERKGYGAAHKYLFQLIPAAILVFYYLNLSSEENLYDFARLFLYVIAFHLLVSYSAFINTDEKNQMGFWNFNLRIFLQFLLSALYSAVLYGGLAIALLAFDKLFDMEIRPERYGQLFFFLAGIFNTWFFCAGIPKPSDFKQEEFSFPKGLKIFTQFVLLPIVAIYMTILYLYLFKILFQWNLPKGWVSYLVMGFSGAGIFSLLLIYPLKDNDNFKWVKIFTKWFFIALIPQIILLFLAISVRTKEYGITERRYYVYVLAFWLAAATLLYVFTNFKNIKFIPVSLSLIAILSSFGPWSSFSVSLNSQLSRFEEVLIRNSVLKDGKAVKITSEVTDEDKQDLYSILEFVIERKKLDRIQPYFNENLEEELKKDDGEYIRMKRFYSKPDKIMALMGITYERKTKIEDKTFLTFSLKQPDALNIDGYSALFFVESGASDTSKKYIAQDSSVVDIRLDKDNNAMLINTKNDSVKINYDRLLKEQISERPELREMTFESGTAKTEIKLIIQNINFNKTEGVFRTTYFRGYLLTKRK